MSALLSSHRRGVVAVVRRSDAFLVIRRSQTVAAPGAYCFPGGGIEFGETEPIALQRELQEELGVEVVPLRRLWQSTTPWAVELTWWLATLDPAADLVPNPAEVVGVHWFTEHDMRRLPELLASNLAFLDAWRNGEFRLHE